MKEIFKNPSVARLPEPDSFDQWVSAQSETIVSGTKDTLNYISSQNYYGLSDLSIYGSWVNLPGYGNSWRPFRSGLSWTPYMNGQWILDPRLGWIWVSNEPWAGCRITSELGCFPRLWDGFGSREGPPGCAIGKRRASIGCAPVIKSVGWR